MSSRSVQYTSSPLLASPTPVWRSKFIVGAIAMGFVALVARASYIQVVGNDFFQKQGAVRFERTLELPASRGRIVDRNGMILASSVPAPSIWAIPEDVDMDRKQTEKLAHLLEMPVSELKAKLANEDKQFVWIKRQIDSDVATQIEAMGIKGIYQRKEYKRIYPEGESVAHVVGFTNVEDKGQEGIELTYNNDLAGHTGSRRVIKDRLGRVVEDVTEVLPPVDGKDIQLSIDSKIQFFAYQKLRDAVVENKAEAGSIVVLDVNTGEVLALANYPSYSPAKRTNLSGAQLRNRALIDTFEPGSTMKPFVVSLGLDKGIIKPETVISTAAGKISISGSTITDAHVHGDLTVNEVIQKSSNVGAVRIAMQLQPREMWEMYSQVGFGQKPQLPFPGVVSGRLRAYKTWRPIEQATMSYGYGLSASLFQLAHAYTVFAHDGQIVPVSMIKRNDQVSGVQIIDPRHAHEVLNMLHMVAGPGGTAPKAQTMGYSVGGKTGTAHKQIGRGYAEHRYRGFFVGVAPIDKPRIVVAVMIDDPTNGKYFGGDVAAPVFSDTVQQTLRMLGVQPDMEVRPMFASEKVEESF